MPPNYNPHINAIFNQTPNQIPPAVHNDPIQSSYNRLQVEHTALLLPEGHNCNLFNGGWIGALWTFIFFNA